MSKKCTETAVSIEKKLLSHASWKTRLKIRFHLLRCKGCKEYFRKSSLIHSWLCDSPFEREMTQANQLTEEERNALLKPLKGSAE